jgi:hypothetical protein
MNHRVDVARFRQLELVGYWAYLLQDEEWPEVLVA